MLAPTSSGASLASQLAALPLPQQQSFLATLEPKELEALRWDWRFWGRPEQHAPAGDDWRYWLVLAGRGFGKTRTINEWLLERIERGVARRITIIAATAADARDVMIEGESGLLNIAPPWLRPVPYLSKRRLEWPKYKARATILSADKPDRLRGPQCDTAIADELAAWRYPEAWDQLLFGLRLGQDPRVAVATTPRPTPLIKSLVKDSLCRVTGGSTHANRANLAKPFLDAILKKFEGTRLGRQEIDAEILDDAQGALWRREKMLDALRAPQFRTIPEFRRVVVAIDPSVSAEALTAETGIVAAGLGVDDHAYVLADESVMQPTPEQWGNAAIGCYHKLKADRILGEVNNGGDLVEANIRAIDKGIPFKKVHASRGKAVRAEPIASLYEQGRVHHVGTFGTLEDQMCQWEPGVSTWSPNRLDALVWALTELMLDGEEPGKLLIVKRRD
jgi:phage terminase large subunit-like protein